VSISSTFYEQRFCTNYFYEALMMLIVWVSDICQKTIVAKAAHKILVKLSLHVLPISFSFESQNLTNTVLETSLIVSMNKPNISDQKKLSIFH